MNENKSLAEEKRNMYAHQLIYRVIAVWVISETIAGGIIHGMHLPFSGIILSGFAVVCISMLAFANMHLLQAKGKLQFEKSSYFSKGLIFKATIIVCIFKMMLSPQSPPTAYFAVLFQGLAGQILFSTKFPFKISCMILGGLALFESAIQRVLVFILVYGADFWEAVNEFINQLAGLDEKKNSVLGLAILYLFIHIFTGIYVGYKAASLVLKMNDQKHLHQKLLISNLDSLVIKKSRKKREKHIRVLFFLIWVSLMIAFLQSTMQMGTPVLPQNKILGILLRSLFIVLTWYFVCSPVLMIWIKNKLKREQMESQHEFTKILNLLPETEKIFRKSWQLSASERNLSSRITLFWKILWINVLTIQ